jgi:hypothetical protein
VRSPVYRRLVSGLGVCCTCKKCVQAVSGQRVSARSVGTVGPYRSAMQRRPSDERDEEKCVVEEKDMLLSEADLAELCGW